MVARDQLMRRMGRTAVAAGLGFALAAGSTGVVPAFAEAVANNVGNTGTTEVTVMTADSLEDVPDGGENYDIDEEDLLAFEVPTVIPFVALANGVLVGPSATVTHITNLSAFGIHVVEAGVVFEDSWRGVSDASASEEENAIDFQFGPLGAITDAADGEDDDVSACLEYNMGYAGSDDDYVAILTMGDVANVTNNLVAGESNKVATITWTISAGNAEDADEDAEDTEDADETEDEETSDADEASEEAEDDDADAEDGDGDAEADDDDSDDEDASEQ